MRQLIILGVAVVGTLGIGIGNTEAAPSVLSDGLTTSSLPTILPMIDVRYYRRYPPPTTTEVGIRTSPPTVTTKTRFVSCSECGQKPIGREA